MRSGVPGTPQKPVKAKGGAESLSEHFSHLTQDLSVPPTSGTARSRLQRAGHLERQGTPSMPEPGRGSDAPPKLLGFRDGFSEPDKDTVLEWTPTPLLGPSPGNYHFKQTASCVCWLLHSCSFQGWPGAFQNLPSEGWAGVELKHFLSPTNTSFASSIKGNFERLALSASML